MLLLSLLAARASASCASIASAEHAHHCSGISAEGVIEAHEGDISGAAAGRNEMKVAARTGKIGQRNELQQSGCGRIDAGKLVVGKLGMRAGIKDRRGGAG